MSSLRPEIQAVLDRHFSPNTHPYRVLETTLRETVESGDTVLDIGCGRSAPVLCGLEGRAKERIGIDLVDFVVNDESIRLVKNDVCTMTGVASGSIDLAYSRSVMEHVSDVDAAYAEIARTLKRGGRYIFITPNLWDYGALISMVVPNRFHGLLVKAVEGRDERNTFPAFYRSNTFRSIGKLAAQSGLRVDRIDYLGQYPNYLVFNRLLFWVGCEYEKFLEGHRRLHWLRGWILCVLSKP